MIRQFLKEGSIYTLSNIATKGVSLLLIPFYTSYFTPADYGILDYLSVFSGLINSVVSLQVGQGVGRYLAESSLSETEKKKIGSTGLNLVILLYTFTTVLLWLSSSFWTEKLSSDRSISEYMFKLSIVNVSVNAIFYQLGVHLRFKRKTAAFAVFSFVHTMANILLILALVLFGKMGIDAVYWASVIIAPILVAAQFYLIRHDYLFYLGLPQIRKLLAFSVPLIPSALSFLVLDVIDRVFISRYFSLDQVGIYGMGAKFPAVLSLLISGFNMAMAPIIVEGYEQESTKEKMNKLFKAYLIAGGIFVLLLSLFSFETLRILTNEDYYPARYVMPLLYFVAYLGGLLTFSVGLFLSGKTYFSSMITVFSAAVNIGLNFWLIPRFGIFGAALSTLVAVIINTLLFFVVSSRFYSYSSNTLLVVMLGLLLTGILSVTFLDSLDIKYEYLLSIKILSGIGLAGLMFIYARNNLFVNDVDVTALLSDENQEA